MLVTLSAHIIDDGGESVAVINDNALHQLQLRPSTQQRPNNHESGKFRLDFTALRLLGFRFVCAIRPSIQIYSVRSPIFTIMYKLKPVFRVPLQIENTCRMYKLKDLQQTSFVGVPTSDKSNEVSFDAVSHFLTIRQLLDQSSGLGPERQSLYFRGRRHVRSSRG